MFSNQKEKEKIIDKDDDMPKFIKKNKICLIYGITQLSYSSSVKTQYFFNLFKLITTSEILKLFIFSASVWSSIYNLKNLLIYVSSCSIPIPIGLLK